MCEEILTLCCTTFTIKTVKNNSEEVYGMKNKIMTGFLITSIVTGATIPMNTLATPTVQAETKQENIDISSALRKIGATLQINTNLYRWSLSKSECAT